MSRRVSAYRGWATAAGLIAAPLYLTLILVLGALEPGFSHRTSLMSVLGGVPGARGLVFNLGVGATGLLVLTFAVGLKRRLPPLWTTRAGFVLLAAGSVGLIGAGVFPCNPGCRNILVEPDLVGRMHILAAFIAGLGTAISPLFFAASMRHDPAWTKLVVPTWTAAALANLPGIAFWVTLLVGHRLQSIEGLVQRMGFVVILAWIAFVAARLRRAGRDEI